MPRFRPRFSLLTALILTALVACGITIWQLWREVGPLRRVGTSGATAAVT